MKTHIQLSKSPKNQRVIVCGSPERAEWFARQLEGVENLARNREYHSYRGTFKGKDILITSHGVGSAGAAICFHELIDAGAKKLIRIGTAGGFYAETKIGDVVVPTGAIRKDGASALMIPPEYPALADPAMALKLSGQLGAGGKQVRTGIVLTTDLFYSGPLGSDSVLYKNAGAVAVEMECATLFVTASLRGVRAAAALVLDGNPLSTAPDDYDPRPERLAASVQRCFSAALEALVADE
ncbi:MAG: nucleoside phosphorylase [Oligoflexia bacterium]|nr:nucleoside phosphorylase [Oligoflexia bacterium]